MSARPVQARSGRPGILARRFALTGVFVLSLVLVGANAAVLGREATARAEHQPVLPATLSGATAALGIRG